MGRNPLPRGMAAFNDLLYRFELMSKKRGIEWAMTREQVYDLTKRKCFYCGCLPAQNINHPHYSGAYIYNGLDRVDNSMGYVIDNVVPCCGTCNRMKGKMSSDDFMAHIHKIKEYLVESQEQ